jgi:hypothetical protein
MRSPKLVSSALPTEMKLEKPMPSRTGPVEDGGAERAGLGEEGDVAGLGHGGGEGRVHADGGHDDAEAVGADDPHLGELRPRGLELFFELLAVFTCFLEAGGEDEDAHDAGVAAFADDVGDELRGDADDGEIRRLRQALDVGIGLDAVDGLALGIHGVDDAVVARADQVAQDGIADAVGPLAGADDGDALWFENLVEVANTHGGLRGDEDGRTVPVALRTYIG